MNEKTLIRAVGTIFALILLLVVGFAACSAGSGPAYQGPGIEIDVDGNKKYKPGYKTWPNYKAPSFKKR